MQTILGEFDHKVFIRDFWQQAPLLIRQACPDIIQIIDGDELAGLACETAVESRLVSYHRNRDHWQNRFGPFTAQDFAELPKTDWTLLVQAVDQWIPEVAELLDKVSFLPRWRLDDIMMSYADQGGSVGPHFDYYDVFLLQVEGEREWRLGQWCDEHSKLQENQPMKLLQDFEQQASYRMQPGDFLYVPAGLAHWGVAQTDRCITCSIGFRAPSKEEVLSHAVEYLSDSMLAHQRYRDTENSIDADPFCINSSVSDSLMTFWQTLPEQSLRTALTTAFAAQLTEPKYMDTIEPQVFERQTLQAAIAAQQGLLFELHPATRIAYVPTLDGQAELYVNGASCAVSLLFAKEFCQGQISLQHIESEPNQTIFLQLLQQGAVFLDD